MDTASVLAWKEDRGTLRLLADTIAQNHHGRAGAVPRMHTIFPSVGPSAGLSIWI
jgi:hypothetical protein